MKSKAGQVGYRSMIGSIDTLFQRIVCIWKPKKKRQSFCLTLIFRLPRSCINSRGADEDEGVCGAWDQVEEVEGVDVVEGEGGGDAEAVDQVGEDGGVVFLGWGGVRR